MLDNKKMLLWFMSSHWDLFSWKPKFQFLMSLKYFFVNVKFDESETDQQFATQIIVNTYFNGFWI
jgi:hypothetical protein